MSSNLGLQNTFFPEFNFILTTATLKTILFCSVT